MGLIVINRESESAEVESRYEGLAPAPPFNQATVNLGRIPKPRYISIRTVGIPGNIFLTLDPVNSMSRAGKTRYRIRDGEVIVLHGGVDYDLGIMQIPNGAVSATGTGIADTFASPIPSARIILNWGNDTAPIVDPPADQGALMPVFRSNLLGAAATITTGEIMVPVSGRVSWIADYAAGVAGNLELLQGGITQAEALAAYGTWDFPDLIAGQYVTVSIRNTGNAGALNVDLKAVRT